MDAVLAFAKTDTGAILGGCLLLVGLATYAVVNAIIIPHFRARNDISETNNIKLFLMIAKFDLLLFGSIGATLLYFHWAT